MIETQTVDMIQYGWLVIVSIACILLLAALVNMNETLKVWRSTATSLIVWRSEAETAKQKQPRRVSKARLPYKLTPPAEKGTVIDLSTPLAERSRVVPFGEEPEAVAASGVGGSKPDGDGGGDAAA